jgi:hypothetical protein
MPTGTEAIVLQFEKPQSTQHEAHLEVMWQIVKSLERLADALAPLPKDFVDTTYIGDKLGYTLVYVAEMAREGRIPKSCIVPGTGNGKPWKFFREPTDKWLQNR